MKTKDNHPCITPDELLEQTRNNVETYGLQVIMVNPTDYMPSFAYSIGLMKTYQHPEIICFGLPNDLSHAIINDVAELVKGGQRMQAGQICDNIFKTAEQSS